MKKIKHIKGWMYVAGTKPFTDVGFTKYLTATGVIAFGPHIPATITVTEKDFKIIKKAL